MLRMALCARLFQYLFISPFVFGAGGHASHGIVVLHFYCPIILEHPMDNPQCVPFFPFRSSLAALLSPDGHHTERAIMCCLILRAQNGSLKIVSTVCHAQVARSAERPHVCYVYRSPSTGTKWYASQSVLAWRIYQPPWKPHRTQTETRRPGDTEIRRH